VRPAAGALLAEDGAGDLITREELVGEALEARIQEAGPFAANGLRHQEAGRPRDRERRGMELDELHVEEGRAGRLSLVATQIPFQVNKAMLLERIADMVRDGKLTGISDLRDESDRDGMRIVIELKRDANAQVVLNQLYKMTAMQTTFGIINLTIVGGRPQILGLKEILEQFIEEGFEAWLRKKLDTAK